MMFKKLFLIAALMAGPATLGHAQTAADGSTSPGGLITSSQLGGYYGYGGYGGYGGAYAAPYGYGVRYGYAYARPIYAGRYYRYR